jgi:hypothetical protein
LVLDAVFDQIASDCTTVTLVSSDPEANLKALAIRQQALSGAQVNWLGTYLHAAQVWQKGLELHEA